MPSVTYGDLGSINGVTLDPKKVPGSVRSRDRNDKQRLAFAADPARPFTGSISVQGAVGDPSKPAGEAIWFDIAEMIINNEGGSWSFEPEGEFASLRVICRDGNYWAAAQGALNGTVANQAGVPIPSFDIDGTTFTAPVGSNAITLAALINTQGIINPLFTLQADVVDGTILRIYNTTGVEFVLTDIVDTPLADMGFTTGTIRGGVISKIRMLR